MRALVIHGVHDLHIDEREAPTPGPGEVEVAITVGGICGSDLHYYHEGGVGDFKLREPMTLGHEVVGRVARIGAGVTGLKEGQRVAVHPARPCGNCGYCKAGRSNLCTDMRFLGSAGRFPHVQGGFAERLVVSAPQIVPIPDSLPFSKAVFAEPLAVGIHAIHRAGDVKGKRVLVVGAGPIGACAVLAAKYAGAAQIVVTDIVDETLAVAKKLGATESINVAVNRDPLPEVDFALEMSGSAPGASACLNAVKRGGKVVLVGMPGGPQPTPLFLIVSREIDVTGSYRYMDEYQEAVAAIAGGLDVTPLLTGSFPVDKYDEAFALASDKKLAMKVQLELNPA
jgi:L-idonate 5-dehydrogenase